ncbi:hypothetical protein SOVF_108000, partial [Spinacia oleracea]
SDAPQVTALKDIIKMKGAEIEDLKLQLEQQEDSEYDGWDYSELNSDDYTFSEFNDVKDGGVDLKRQYSKNETTDFQVEQDTKDNITTSPEEEEKQKLQENEADMKLRKPDEESASMTGFGIGSRVRRRHSKRKRKETLRNRRLGDEEQHKFEINQAEKPYSEVINKLNQTTETGNDGQYTKKEGAWNKIGKDQLPLLSNKLNQTRLICKNFQPIPISYPAFCSHTLSFSVLAALLPQHRHLRFLLLSISKSNRLISSPLLCALPPSLALLPLATSRVLRESRNSSASMAMQARLGVSQLLLLIGPGYTGIVLVKKRQ